MTLPPGLSSTDFAYLAPEIALTVGALVLLVVDVLLPGRPRTLAVLALTALAATAATLVPLRAVDAEVAHGLLAVDRFALFFKTLFLVAAAFTVLLSVRHLEFDRANPGEYYFLILCATLGMMILAGGIDLVTVFVGLETMSVSFYVLVGFIKPNPRSNEAAVKYFLLGSFSLAILLYGMSLLYGLSGTTSLRTMAGLLTGESIDVRLLLAIGLVVAGVGFKLAAVPFHMWAPDVYEGAPTPVAAFLSVGSKAAAFAMLLRIVVEGVPGAAAHWQLLLELLAVATMTGGNLAALTQSNLKRLLAYSSIAQVGYALIGIAAGTSRGAAATLMYLAVYLLMQIGAFAVLMVARRRDLAGEDLKDLSGLSRRQPMAAFAMLLFMLSLGGVPPTAGFQGKLSLFGAAVDTGLGRLAVVAVLNSALSLYYYLRVAVFMYLRDDEGQPATERSMLLSVVIGSLAAATLAIGLFPQVLLLVADASVRSLQIAPLSALLRSW